ncbi:hypothetical protein CYMTET_35805, partial [Cymbomonas tetramitiformis]
VNATGTAPALLLQLQPSSPDDAISGAAERSLAWPPSPADEGYSIHLNTLHTVISSRSPQGVLYGAFELLRRLRREDPGALAGGGEVVRSAPSAPLRHWDLWDNLDGSVERGYAGPWQHRFDVAAARSSVVYPLGQQRDEQRAHDLARLLASVGINGIGWSNVNACDHGNQHLLSSRNIASMRALVALFYSYGIHSFLTPCFDSPQIVGGLFTSNPQVPEVKAWWAKKIEEVAGAFGDAFRGLVFKGNTEGQPGPGSHGMSQLQGANFFAELLEEVGAICIWRAFSHPEGGVDQALYQFQRFENWDGEARWNVALKIKNGPYDFQVREPVHSLFGHLSNTSLILEFQAAQEYFGHAKHLVALPSQWSSYLGFDLSSRFPPYNVQTLAQVASGGIGRMPFSGIAAVSNIGTSRNWTGHVFSAVNTYGFGRLAWTPTTPAADIMREWVEVTFPRSSSYAVSVLTRMLQRSWEVYENYTSSLGWGFACAANHYDLDDMDRRRHTDHRASATHIGYPRNAGGGYASTYNAKVAARFQSIEQCPEELLLSFHQVPYTHRLRTKNNSTVLEWIYRSHMSGVNAAEGFVTDWLAIEGHVDLGSYPGDAFVDITTRLEIGASDAAAFAKSIREYFETLTGCGLRDGRLQCHAQ